MSLDVSLCADANGAIGEVLEWNGDPFEEGGTYQVGGTGMCELNITSNYRIVHGSLVVDLHGRLASETVNELCIFSQQFAEEARSSNYWDPTPGNAKAAVDRLILFAQMYPDGRWQVE